MSAITENLTVPTVLQSYSREQLHLIAQTLAPEERSEAEEIIEDWKCSEDPLYWLRRHTLTENEQWKKEKLDFKEPFPFKPFPGNQRDYFDVLFDYFKSCDRLFTPKTRDMMTSWSAVGWGTHQAQWHKATVVVQTESEDKAKKLVKYSKILWDNQPDSLKERHPLKGTSQLSIEWADGGEFFGIPCGETKIRIHHPTIYIMDEAAFLPGAQALYDAAHPVAGQIIAISSAGPGWFGNQCSQ